jgi:multicomponent Na+:H+ antiporter subunit B
VSESLLAGLFVLLLALAGVAVRAGDLLIAALALGAYGFVMALIWSALGAVDVAFTEAVVGAGATTVFFLAALLRTSRRRSPAPGRLRSLAAAVAAACGLGLAVVVATLPPWADPAAPPAAHVSPRYLERAVAETGTPNVVTAVLADYRSYDTLVETLVIFTAALGCWLLLRRDGP